MPIKNYSTTIGVEKTISEIEHTLAKHGAKAILKEYDVSGRPTAINFIIDMVEGKTLPYRLPIDIKAAMEKINYDIEHPQKGEGRIERKRKNDMDYARRVAWRCLKNWVDAQMAQVDFKQIKVQQLFLPFAYDMLTKKTFFEVLEEKQFRDLPLLEKGVEDGRHPDK